MVGLLVTLASKPNILDPFFQINKSEINDIFPFRPVVKLSVGRYPITNNNQNSNDLVPSPNLSDRLIQSQRRGEAAGRDYRGITIYSLCWDFVAWQNRSPLRGRALRGLRAPQRRG